jgi:hypothetical protein
MASDTSVYCATTVNGTLATAFASGQTIDGVTLTLNMRILIKNQSTATENGIYVVTAGTPTRSADMQTGFNAGGFESFVQAGTVNAKLLFYCTNLVGSDIVGTDNLTFVPLLAAGSGITLTNLGSAIYNISSSAITALTGDVTATGPGSVAATLATVNGNVGSFGSATQVGSFTVNGKGLITAASNITITGTSPVGAALNSGNIWIGNGSNVAAANAITGDISLSNAGVTSLIATSNTSLTSLVNLATVGTIGTGTWQGTAVGATFGGTSQNTYTLGDTLYSSASNTLSKLAGNTTTGIQYLSQTGTGAVSAAPAWATISGADITGAALTKTDDTNVTLTLGGTPTTALLRAASITAGWTGQLSLSRGGTNASLTASNGGIVYSNATQLQILSGTATANQVLLSGASTTPAWSTATYPATTTVSQLLYSSSTNVISGLATANSAILVTSSTGVPTWSSTMTNGQIVVGVTSSTPAAVSVSGDATLANTGALTLSTVNSNVGSFTAANITVNAKGLITAAANGLALFYAYGPTAAIAITGSVAYTTITTYNAPTFDSGTYSYSAGVVTFLVAGTYEVASTVQINSNGNTGTVQGNFFSRLLLNAGAVAGSETASGMPRIAGTNNRCSISKTFVIVAAVSNTLALQYSQPTTTTVAQVTANSTTFTIKRITT